MHPWPERDVLSDRDRGHGLIRITPIAAAVGSGGSRARSGRERDRWQRKTFCITIRLMTTITFRADNEVDEALAALTSGDRDRSQVIREAILAAWRLRQAEQLRAEAEAVATDTDDVAEARAVLADMESLRAW